MKFSEQPQKRHHPYDDKVGTILALMLQKIDKRKKDCENSASVLAPGVAEHPGKKRKKTLKYPKMPEKLQENFVFLVFSIPQHKHNKLQQTRKAMMLHEQLEAMFGECLLFFLIVTFILSMSNLSQLLFLWLERHDKRFPNKHAKQQGEKGQRCTNTSSPGHFPFPFFWKKNKLSFGARWRMHKGIKGRSSAREGLRPLFQTSSDMAAKQTICTGTPTPKMY